LLLILALVVGQLCWAEETTTPKVKNATAPGRHYSRHHSNRGSYNNDEKHYRAPVIDDYVCDLEATILVVSSKHHVKEEKSYTKPTSYGGNQQSQGYNQQSSYGESQGNNYNSGGNSYGGGGNSYNQAPYGQGPYRSKRNSGGYGSSAPSYDQTQQEGGGYNNGASYGGKQEYEEKPKRHEYATPQALRLKCSHIAIHSEHDCHTCCHLSARRYHSVSRHEIFGFIIDSNEIKYDDKGYVRSKRSSNNYESQPLAPSYDQNYSPAPEYLVPTGGYSSDSGYSATQSSYAGSSHGYDSPPKNARCVCCAPKRHQEYHHRRNYNDRSESREY